MTEIKDQEPAQDEGGPVGLTHVLLVVDRSGSMSPVADDVRGGFNAFIADLDGKPERDAFRVTVLLFDHEWHTLCVSARLDAVPALDRVNYQVRGTTALYDAVGAVITSFEQETVLAEHDRVLLVVQTDGHENASREYRADVVKGLIEDRVAGGKWTAVYLGAGPGAWDGGAAMGMRSVNTTADGATPRAAYGAVATASAAYAGGATRAETFEVLRSVGVSGDDQ